MTAAERDQFVEDALLLGPRVATWLASESTGWSALWDAEYWHHVDRLSPRPGEGHWPGGAWRATG